MKAKRGSRGSITLSLTLVLVGGGWLMTCPNHSASPGMTWYPSYGWLVGLQGPFALTSVACWKLSLTHDLVMSQKMGWHTTCDMHSSFIQPADTWDSCWEVLMCKPRNGENVQEWISDFIFKQKIIISWSLTKNCCKHVVSTCCRQARGKLHYLMI
jgi:hypothetical protein